MITLTSDDLNSKWGFDDGDLLGDILCQNGYADTRSPASSHLSFKHEVLARLVEKHLLPALPAPVEANRIGTHHNPIRAENCDAPEGIEVSVPVEKVLEIAAEVVREYASERGSSLPK